ncbi:MAG: glycerophosphodiester phosphodiesterase [Variovorax sp.]
MSRRIRTQVGAALAICCMALCAALPATAQNKSEPLDLQGHRGARALLPENSLPAFARALSLGVTTLELDIAITKDGVPVISHDPALNPDITRGPDGQFLAARGPAISTLTFDELSRYDVGAIKPGTNYARQFASQTPMDGTRIPKLADLFALVRQSGNTQVRFAIETKLSPLAPHETVAPEAFARAVIGAIREGGMESRSSILSFDWRTLKVVQQEAPGIPTVYLTIQQRTNNNVQADSPWTAGMRLRDHGSVPKMIKAAGGNTWSSYWGDLSRTDVEEAQGLGLKVLAWTVNDAAQIGRMIDLGVDGVVTDRPDVAREEMARRGLPLPAATPVTAGR